MRNLAFFSRSFSFDSAPRLRMPMCAASLFALSLSASVAFADAHGDTADACGALADMRIADTNLLSASMVPESDALPAYCRVLGYVRPAINFEVRLPAPEQWTGRFHMAGCGGFCGQVDGDSANFFNSINFALTRGYAGAIMDSGHWGESSRDGLWAFDNRQAEVDWAYRAVPETAHVAETLIAAFYGEPAAHSYFHGCSTGGRMANRVALTHPDLFDGILSGAPALDYTGLVGTFVAGIIQADTRVLPEDRAEGEPCTSAERIVRMESVPVIQAAVLEQCDGTDGLVDGLISDPRLCQFDPGTLLCEADTTNGCLTEDEVAVLQVWYGGVRDSDGTLLYPGGIPLGSEPYWALWLTGNPAIPGGLIPLFHRDFLQYMAFQTDPGDSYFPVCTDGHSTDPTVFDLDRDPGRLAFMGNLYNVDSADLSAFREAGGRMILYHGWADAIVTPMNTIEYVERVMDEAGGAEATGSFLRLFMIPGMDHCGFLPTGPGIDQFGFDPLTALEQWVEEGAAPASLLTTRNDPETGTVRTRPACPYPQRALYDGSGDPNLAESFTCGVP